MSDRKNDEEEEEEEEEEEVVPLTFNVAQRSSNRKKRNQHAAS